eukprot:4322906-Amphidinium_carterae.1
MPVGKEENAAPLERVRTDTGSGPDRVGSSLVVSKRLSGGICWLTSNFRAYNDFGDVLRRDLALRVDN